MISRLCICMPTAQDWSTPKARRLENERYERPEIQGARNQRPDSQGSGGTPVPMPMPETYQMLQKGVVEGSLYPFESNKGWKLGEVTDYMSAFSTAYTTSFFVVMNKDKWKKIAKKVQEIIRAINKEWIVKHGEAWD